MSAFLLAVVAVAVFVVAWSATVRWVEEHAGRSGRVAYSMGVFGALALGDLLAGQWLIALVLAGFSAVQARELSRWRNCQLPNNNHPGGNP